MNNTIREYVESRIAKEGFLTSKRKKKNSPLKKAIVSISMVGVAFTSLLFGCGKKKETNIREPKPVQHEIETTTTSKSKEKIKEKQLKANESTTVKKSSTASKNTSTTTKKNESKTNTTQSSSKSTNSSSTSKSSSQTSNSEKTSTTKSETKESGNTFVVTLDNNNPTIVYNDNKDIDYKIVDENDKLIKYGSYDENNNIDGYVYDDKRQEYVRAEEVGKYIYSDLVFYDASGNIVINKGELIQIETYESAKKELNYENVNNLANYVSEEVNISEESTTEEEVYEEENNIQNSSARNESANDLDLTCQEPLENYNIDDKEENNNLDNNITDYNENVEYYEGILKADGTYTVNGIVYESKEVYEYFLLNPDDFYMDENGIVRPISEINSNDYQKVLK